MAAERMLGMGGAFRYAECPQCGTLTLDNVPDDLAPYYPAWYPPFQAPGASKRASDGTRLLQHSMNLMLRSRRVATGIASASARLRLRDARWFSVLAGRGLTTGSAVLDIGCGSGHRLATFRRFGFHEVTGTDPYLTPRTEVAAGIPVHPDVQQAVSGRYELVMLHHSLEHVDDPSAALYEATRVLAPGGTVVVRIPLAGTYAWRTYGVNWVQLDAPRHQNLFTERSFRLAAEAAGFTVTAVLYDSDAFQFWGSELYQRGYPLAGVQETGRPAWTRLFTRRDIRAFHRAARRLNASCDGDQATFALRLT